MESQMARPHDVHDYDQHDPRNVRVQNPVVEGEDEHHQEKKSVLKKVKDKAKKLKDKVKLHGHDKHHEGGHVPDDHDLYEDVDEDEDEEMAEDPEVHGAPIYDSAAIRDPVHGQGGRVGDPRTYGNPTTMQEEHTGTDRRMERFVPGQEENELEPPKFLIRTTVITEVPSSPVNSPTIVEQSHADPVKGFVHEQERVRGQPEVNLEVPVGLEEDPDAPKGRFGDHDPSNHQTKVTDPTGSGGKEAGITPMLHSFDRMNIYGESEQGEKHNLSSRPGDGHFSMFPTGSHDQFSAEPTPPISISPQENPESGSKFVDTMKAEEHPYSDIVTEEIPSGTSAIANKKNPESGSKSLYTLKAEEDPHSDIADKPSNQSCYTEKISYATSVIADKAKATTNFIASKLGYEDRDSTVKQHETAQDGQGSIKPASTMDYGKKVAATVPEKLTPVYEKVAGVGNTVMSKVHGNTNTSTGTGNEAKIKTKGQDKGVSVKDYFADKLRPGEEDRALSEVISETLNRGKTEARTGKKERPMGKVTESEEVKRRLGSSEEENSCERKDSDFAHNAGNAVVDKLKGAVGSWFVKDEESKANAGTEGLSSTNASG